jgi:hypothetical protein
MSTTKRSPGRPKKPGTEQTAEAVLATLEPEKFTFKSKFKRDKITLIKAHKIKNPDGSMTVLSPQIYAEFDRNTWSTTNPEYAGILRQRIEDGLSDRSSLPPLDVIETTSI